MQSDLITTVFCRYGLLDKSVWPYWVVGALSPSNSFYAAGPMNGCGQCFEIICENTGGQYAVSPWTPLRIQPVDQARQTLLMPEHPFSFAEITFKISAYACVLNQPITHLECDMQGRCSGSGNSVTIMVSDACPECEADHIDLQVLTYDKVMI